MAGLKKGIVLSASLLIGGLLLFALSTGRAGSMSNGIIAGRSQSGCSPCHGANPSSGVKVAISGPDKVALGATHKYTVTVTGGPEAGGGLDVSASDGRLSPGDNTQLVNSEITHQDKKSRSWSFSWTAPVAPGQSTLWAAGNASNNDSSPAGDAWNMGNLEISVTAATPEVVAPPVSSPGSTESSGNPGPTVAKPAPPATKVAPTMALKPPLLKARGEPGIINAYLQDGGGKPISGVNIRFFVDETFFLSLGNVPVDTFKGPLVVDYGAQEGTVKGLMEIGQARTKADGTASLRYSPAISGDLKLIAKYESANQVVAEATAIWPGAEHSVHYHPEIGIKSSFLKPSWILGILLGGIWFTFLFVLYQVYAISRE